MAHPRKMAVFLMILFMSYVVVSSVYVSGQLTAIITGRVVDEWNNGIENVEVKVYSSVGVYVETISTSSAGSFSIQLPIATTYTLHFFKRGYAKVTRSVYLEFGGEEVNLGDIVLLKALRLSSTVLSQVANTGDKLTLPFTMSNIGEEPETVEFFVTKPEGWSARVHQIGEWREVTKVYLSSSVSITLQLEVAIPITAGTGNYNLSLTVAGETMSTVNFTIKVETSIEPVISCQFPGKSVAPGKSVRFSVKVNNPFDFKQRFRFLLDSIPYRWKASVKSGEEDVTEAILDSKEALYVIVEVYVPLGEAEGDYNLIFNLSSSAISENLTLSVVVKTIPAGTEIELQAMQPYLDAYAGSQAKYRLMLNNLGGTSEFFALKIHGLPPALRAWFEDPNGGEITRIKVEAGKSQQFNLVVAIPKGMALGASNFTVSASSQSLNKSVELNLNVLGLYKIKVTNENFYMKVTVGGKESYKLIVKNEGTGIVTDLDVATVGRVPSGFNVTTMPTILSSLNPDEEATFTITVTTRSDVNAGNYYVDFEVHSDQTEAILFSLQVGVEQQMSWIYISGALVTASIIVLFLIYRRFGRR